jgi:F-type H+-transporting ATPase subunit b
VLIDWFTVVAQIINFLILVALLKHFLYGRIINAMDEREQKIVSRLEEADKEREQAEQEAESYRTKSQELEDRRDALMKEAKEQAEHRRKELTEQARHEVDQLRERWRTAVAQEKEAFLRDLRQRVSDHVYTVVRRVLRDLANADLERRVVDSFIERLQGLDSKERDKMEESAHQAGGTVAVYTPFEMSEADRRKLTEAIQQRLRNDIGVEYHTSPDMILGIEVRSRGHKVAWSVEEYLASVESHISRFLEGEQGEKGSGEHEPQPEAEA